MKKLNDLQIYEETEGQVYNSTSKSNNMKFPLEKL